MVTKNNIPVFALCFSYSIIGGNSQFTINPSTGQIITSALLDRETKDNYTLIVVSSDAGSPESLSSSTSVLVTVTDVNDNPPRFQHHPYVTHIPSPTLPGNQIDYATTWTHAKYINQIFLSICYVHIYQIYLICISSQRDIYFYISLFCKFCKIQVVLPGKIEEDLKLVN